MNPYDEQRLRNEVIYLHYLWHQGPPGNPNPNPEPRPRKPSTTLHTPTHTTPFKKKKKKQSGNRPGSARNTSESEPGHDSDPEWHVNPTPQVSTSWPEVKPKTRTEPVSPQDQAKLLAMQVQRKGIESCVEFFSQRVDEESDEGDESEELGEEDYLTENDGIMDSEVYKFLLELFINDEKLRGYYEKNYESGDFSCLVCFGIGKKLNKRFKDCLAIVQHSIAISKTNRKRAHRAFGQVVCKVLGWDIDRLPVIVLKGEPLGKALANSGQDVAVRRNDEVHVEHMTVFEDNGGSKGGKNGEVIEMAVTDVNKDGGELVICEVDVDNRLENTGCTVLNKEADKDIAVDCHKRDTSNYLEELESKFMNPEVDKDKLVDCQGSGPSWVTSSGWSCAKPVDENSYVASGWPALKPKRPLVIRLASAEEQAKLSAFQLQQKILDACRKFFEKSAGSDSDESADEDGNDLMDEDRSDKSEVFKFFLKVFTENSEFRSYYEKNYGGGEFCCLVCGGIGKKVWQRFKDCLGLLQHSTGILKTKKKRAHRAFGQVVCKVLGWDIDRLPTIVLKGEPLCHSLSKLGVSQVKADTNAGGNKDDLSAPLNNAGCELSRKEDSDLHLNNDILIASGTSPNEDGTNKHVNNVQDGSSDMEGGKTGATDTLTSPNEDEPNKHVNNVQDGSSYMEGGKTGATDTLNKT